MNGVPEQLVAAEENKQLLGCQISTGGQTEKQYAASKRNTGVLRSAQDDDEKQKQIPFREQERQQQRLRGWVAVYIPTIAKCAMDGAPERWWWAEENRKNEVLMVNG
jgi:hypothetical protein